MELRKIFLGIALMISGCSSAPQPEPQIYSGAVTKFVPPSVHTIPGLVQHQRTLEADLILNLWLFLHTQRRWLLDECDDTDNLARKAACERLVREVELQMRETWTILLEQETNQTEKVE